MERRNTIQRECVLNAVRTLRNHATAEDVYTLVTKEHPSIGKGTVYRNLNILVQEGEITKVEVPGGPDRFDHTLGEHYHVKCVKCNGISDVEIDEIPDLNTCISDTHGIRLLGYDILFKGICPACQENLIKEV